MDLGVYQMISTSLVLLLIYNERVFVEQEQDSPGEISFMHLTLPAPNF